MKQLVVEAVIVGVAPLGYSRVFQSEKKPREGHDAFEERCWMERLHTNPDGFVILPPMSVKKTIEHASKKMGDTIPGKGKSTYSFHVRSGVVEVDPLSHIVCREGKQLKAKDVEKHRVFVPSDGKVGGGRRVNRNFPIVSPPWEVTIKLSAFAEPLIEAPDKLREFLIMAGRQIGIGFFRPESESGGYFGRFGVKEYTATVVED